MGEQRKYLKFDIRRNKLKNGGLGKPYLSYGYVYHVCRLHHPKIDEINEIRQELANGATKISVAHKHNLGNGTARLRRLLKKWELLYPSAETIKIDMITNVRSSTNKRSLNNTEQQFALKAHASGKRSKEIKFTNSDLTHILSEIY